MLPLEERSKWEYFWCVDPLDGTKEFIKRNGQFTVNIGLCKGCVGWVGRGIADASGLSTFHEPFLRTNQLENSDSMQTPQGLSHLRGGARARPGPAQDVLRRQGPGVAE